jgi:DNA-binding response OmpR family regulator
VHRAERASSDPALCHGAPRRARRRILLVDDEVEMLETLASILEDDYAVVSARDGAEALRLLDAGVVFDLIVLDLSMPVLDGAGFARAMRERGVVIPFIVASADWDARNRARQIGAADWITKPFHVAQLEAKLERALRTTEERLAG